MFATSIMLIMLTLTLLMITIARINAVFVLFWWDLIGNFCSVVLTFDHIDCQVIKKNIFEVNVRHVITCSRNMSLIYAAKS
jgi:hypothetical protein